MTAMRVQTGVDVLRRVLAHSWESQRHGEHEMIGKAARTGALGGDRPPGIGELSPRRGGAVAGTGARSRHRSADRRTDPASPPGMASGVSALAVWAGSALTLPIKVDGAMFGSSHVWVNGDHQEKESP